MEFAWADATLMSAIAIVGAICIALVRNSLIALPCRSRLARSLVSFVARHDPSPSIAAVAVPIVVIAPVFTAVLGHATHAAPDDRSDRANQNP